MEWLKQHLPLLIDAKKLVNAGGLTVITAIVFSETGLFVGFFLPGDTLLFTSGALASQGHFSIVTLNVLAILAAIIGDTVGYWIGRKTGPALFSKPRSLFFNPAHLRRAHDFYEKHGGKTIVLARFMPIIRTFAPVVAGMGRMEYGRFIAFNVFGGIGWVISMTLAGYFLGKIEFVNDHFEAVIIGIVFLSIAPGLIAAAKEWRSKKFRV